MLTFANMGLDKVKYWTEISDYDLETAKTMLDTGRWPAPYSHNLINIAQSCGLGDFLDESQKALISEIYSKTKELQEWVKTML